MEKVVDDIIGPIHETILPFYMKGHPAVLYLVGNTWKKRHDAHNTTQEIQAYKIHLRWYVGNPIKMVPAEITVVLFQ